MADESFSRSSPYAPTRPSLGAGVSSSFVLPVSEFTTDALNQLVRDVSGDLWRFMQVSRAQKQIVDLNGQVMMLHAVTQDLLGEAASPGQSSSLGISTASQFHSDRLWQSVNLVGDCCRNDTVGPLHDRLNGMIARCKGPSEYGIKLRLLGDDLGWYENIFRVLKCQAETLQVLLAAIRLSRHDNTINAEGELSRDARENVSILYHSTSVLRQKLRDRSGFITDSHPEAILEMRRALDVADSLARTMPAVSMNRHFLVPNQANTIFTGRRQQLQVIEDAFSTPYSDIQKRLVIQGGPGAGKTELAIKYAEEHMSIYWGVFWVDASSRSNAKQSYAAIAITGGVDPNENSAKHWLSGRNYPWLLIIDNADDDEVQLGELFPLGPLGCVLVTTRNPSHISLGTAGDRSLEIEKMDDNEGTELLLRAATEPRPWTQSAIELATSICRHLYYLPLAIFNAGKAIANDLATLSNYIGYFETAASRIRREQKRRRNRSMSGDASMSIYGSYEILFQSLQGNAARDERFQDALELLQMFSYMHFNNIRLDVLIQSTVGPLQEARAVAEKQQEDDNLVRRLRLKIPRQSWSDWMQDVLRNALRSKLFATPPIIPDVLKNHDNLDDDVELEGQIEFRLRPALTVLVSRSLVVKVGQDRDRHNGYVTDRYNMHPLVHKWIRKRPQMSLGEQALVCQMATTVLCRAVRLAGEDSADAKVMRREMKPHIDHVRDCAAAIRRGIDDNQRRNKPTWSLTSGASKPTFGPLQAEESGRFSRVYMESGAYKDAAELLSQVIDYLVPRLGENHTLTNLAKAGLSGTLFHLTQYNDATGLLDQVYESRKLVLGAEHPRTLDITTELGRSLLAQGFMTKSRLLLEAALKGIVKTYGPDHPKTLICKNQIGRVHWQLFNWDEAERYHEEALEGLRHLLRQDSSLKEEVLACEEDLAMVWMQPAKAKAEQAVQIMRDAVQTRLQMQGKEHPFTLLAKAKLGQALGAYKQFEEAEILFRETLEVAVRNYGEDHLVILAAKSWYARILMGLEQFDRAEQYHKEATDKVKYAQAAAKDGEHPDRIIHVWRLSDCMERQGKFQEALELCRELEESVPKVGGHGLGPNHKFYGMLRQRREGLQESMLLEERNMNQTTTLAAQLQCIS